MKTGIKLCVFLLLAETLIHFSCKKELSCENCIGGNKPPIANAGLDAIIVLPIDSVVLNGSSSLDPDGSIVSWRWTKISGPVSSNIIKADSSKTLTKTLAMGVYKFELAVTDNGGLVGKDTVQIIVNDPLVNQPPIANAETDQTISLPVDSTLLNGNLSFDPDGTIVSYQWTKISGPVSSSIINPLAMQTMAKNLSQGVYQFELKVTDNAGLIGNDTIQINVNASSPTNLTPVAKAGNDTTIQSNQTSCTPVPITITLNGSSSYDPDGTIVSYLWTGSNSITNPNSAVTTVTGLVPGTSIFILRVTDNNGGFAFDTVNITIIPANRPLVPAQLIPIGTLTQTRGGMAVTAAGNKILFAGGSAPLSQGCATARVDIYDIVSGIWTVAQLSQARVSAGVAVLGSKIFFGGGIVPEPYGGGCGTWNLLRDRSSAIDIYDAATNTWSIAQLSSPRLPTGASAGNQVVFAGGDDDCLDCIHTRIDIYNAGSNSWSTSSLSEARHISQAAVAGNRIFFGGGSIGLYTTSGGNLSKQIDIYDASSSTWSVDTLSRLRGEMGAISANNKIYWAGGFVWDPTINDWNITNSVEIKDLATNITSFDCLSAAVGGVTAVRKNNKIIFFAGRTRFDIFDLTTNSWSIGVLPANVSGGNLISLNNILYVSELTINGVFSNQVFKLEF